MAATAIVQARVDEDIKRQATAVLDAMGLSVSDVVRMVLTRTATEGALPAGLGTSPEAYDAWFRAKVQEALDDPRPSMPGDEVEAYFAKRRAHALLKAR